MPALDLAGEELLHLAADSLPSGFLLFGADGTIKFVNQQLERQFGYTRFQIIGQPLDVLLPCLCRSEDDRAALIAAAEVEPAGRIRETAGLRADGSEFPVELSLFSLRTGPEPLVLASVADLTASRQADEAHQRAVDDQLSFERLVAELSVQFINLPRGEISAAIQAGLRRVGEGLAIDVCSVFRLQDEALVDPIRWERAQPPSPVTPAPTRAWFPWTMESIQRGELIQFGRLAEVPNDVDRDSFRLAGVRAAVVVPIGVAGDVVGAVSFSMSTSDGDWTPELVHRLRVLGAVVASAFARRRHEAALDQAAGEVRRLSEQLRTENVAYRRDVQDRLGRGVIVGESDAIRYALDQAEQVASTDSTVLLLGETGTGKELFATHIHGLSARRGQAMVRVNCSAIPSSLIESELFGREKGAFTGALTRQIGRFELADRSSIFLDEIGDLPTEVQVKLLRVLEERQIERLGNPRPIRVDTRIVAATHRDLEQRMADGAFREDLFYRLNVFPIVIPPLRERPDDIPLLVWSFVEEFARAFGKQIDAIPREHLTALQRYSWPGNIRELRNVVERAMIVATGPRLSIALPAIPAGAAPKRSIKLIDVERDHIRRVLEGTGWRIRGASGAADRLGLKPTTLETRMQKLGLKRPRLQSDRA